MIWGPVSEPESHLGQRHQPEMRRRCLANALNLFPLSAAQRTSRDLLLARPGRKCLKADIGTATEPLGLKFLTVDLHQRPDIEQVN